MKQIQPELHRLTTLQRQILKWIRLEGGGCLPVDRLYTSLYFTQSDSHPDVISLSERMCEAVEQLARSGYVEVRYENMPSGRMPSLYDLGSLYRNIEMSDDEKWHWKEGNVPEVALTDFGSHYASRMG